MRILALDIGSKRIGVAISDEVGLIASPCGTVLRGPKVGAEVRELALKYGAGRLLVGLPLGMSGREGPQAAYVRAYLEEIIGEIDLPMEYWDERLTTSIAERSLIANGTRRAKRKEMVDAVAASVILQGYLDHQRWRASPR